MSQVRILSFRPKKEHKSVLPFLVRFRLRRMLRIPNLVCYAGICFCKPFRFLSLLAFCSALRNIRFAYALRLKSALRAISKPFSLLTAMQLLRVGAITSLYFLLNCFTHNSKLRIALSREIGQAPIIILISEYH